MTDTLSDAQLAELERLEGLATQGEWTWEDDPPTVYAGRGHTAHGLNLFGRLTDLDWNGENNLNFVCSARNAFPSLLALARRADALEVALATLLDQIDSAGPLAMAAFDGREIALARAALAAGPGGQGLEG